MIIVLKPECSKEQLEHFTQSITRNHNVKVNTWVGTQSTVLGLIGDTSTIDIDYVAAQSFVESVKRVQEPYKKANRKFHHPMIRSSPSPADSRSAAGSLALIAGPCSVESEEQICEVGRTGQKCRSTVPPRRCFQTQNQPLRFPGHEGPGSGASAGSPGKNRPCPLSPKL